MNRSIVYLFVSGLLVFLCHYTTVKTKTRRKKKYVIYLNTLFVGYVFSVVWRIPYNVYANLYSSTRRVLFYTVFFICSILCLILICIVFKNLNIYPSKIFKVNTQRNDFSIFRSMLYVTFPIILLFIFLYLNRNHDFKIPSINDLIQYSVVAPVFEEIGFRKIMPKMVSPERRISFLECLFFSVFFTLSHFSNTNIFYYIFILIFSMYMYYLAEKTNSIVYGILYHSLSNLLRLFYVL